MCNDVIGRLSGRKFIIDVITFFEAVVEPPPPLPPIDVCSSGELGAIKGPLLAPDCMCLPALFISLLNTNKASVLVASLMEWWLRCRAAAADGRE